MPTQGVSNLCGLKSTRWEMRNSRPIPRFCVGPTGNNRSLRTEGSLVNHAGRVAGCHVAGIPAREIPRIANSPPRVSPPTHFPIVRESAINGHGWSAGDTRRPKRFKRLSLSTDSLHSIPSTWFTHFRTWGSAPREHENGTEPRGCSRPKSDIPPLPSSHRKDCPTTESMAA